MSCVWPVNTLFHTWDRCLFIFVDSRLKISFEKKSRQIQAERSDFILNPGDDDDDDDDDNDDDDDDDEPYHVLASNPGGCITDTTETGFKYLDELPGLFNPGDWTQDIFFYLQVL